MKLNRFRIKEFRSVLDSGWIECQNVTAFAGENESGKTTIMLALMKLMDTSKEAGGVANVRSRSAALAKINFKKDIAIDKYDEVRPEVDSKVFIFAEFTELSDEIHAVLSSFSKKYVRAKSIMISKTYGGIYDVDILSMFEGESKNKARDYIISIIPHFLYHKEVTEIDSKIDLLSLALRLHGLKDKKKLTARETMISNLLSALDIWESNLIKTVVEVHSSLTLQNQAEVNFIEIFKKVPLFEMRVTRGFNTLNREFLKWWGKDDLTIGFEPYERGIKINIVDKFGNVFNLENRSTGFRRFFALFLSFSIAGKDDLKNSILLFDEAGAALHPLTQRRLANFFDELGKRTQLIFNTHTSYMLAVKNMNRVRVVYKDKTNHTRISDTLNINADRTNEMSLFPIHSSLAMYVAEKAMAGCLPVVVLNEWDENYLSLIKNILSAKGKLNTVYTTLVFASGENGIDAATEVFGEESDLPVVLLPSDTVGKAVKDRLLAGRYSVCPQKVLEISDFDKKATIFEDLIPSNFVEIFSRLYLEEILGKGFRYDKKSSLLEQIETYAKDKNITLPESFRYEMAKRMKLNTMQYFRDVKISSKYHRLWVKIWKTLLAIG